VTSWLRSVSPGDGPCDLWPGPPGSEEQLITLARLIETAVAAA